MLKGRMVTASHSERRTTTRASVERRDSSDLGGQRKVKDVEVLGRFAKSERIQVTGLLQSGAYTNREGQRRTTSSTLVRRSEPAPLPRRAVA